MVSKPKGETPIVTTMNDTVTNNNSGLVKWSVKRLCIVLAILSVVIYANTLTNGYVFDDAGMITNNAIVAKGIKGIPQLLTSTRIAGAGISAADNYRPLSLVMFAIERDIFGENPLAGHLFNVLFYAACVVLLFLFLYHLFDEKKVAVAFITSLLFLLHPIHTEVVANIKSRDEIMCFFFAFLSLNLFISFNRSGKWAMAILATFSLFLAYLAKETVLAFIFIIPHIFYYYWRNNNRRAGIITIGTLLATGIFLFIRSRILGVHTFNVGEVDFMDNALVNADVSTRIATGFSILGRYLVLLVAPIQLSCDYCFNSIPITGYASVAVIASLIAYKISFTGSLRLMAKDRQSPVGFAAMFYLATIAMFSNIPFLIGAAMGERFLFFASVGFCLLVALAMEKWLFGSDTELSALFKKGKVLAILLPLCLVYAGLTMARNADWKSNYTLFKSDVEKLPENAKLHYFLANELVEVMIKSTGDASEQKQFINDAIQHLHIAIVIYPKFAAAHTEMGNSFMVINNYDSAAYYFGKAIGLDKYQSIAANNLAVIKLRQGKFEEAIGAYRKSVAVTYDNAQAYYDMGGCFIQLKQYDSAIAVLNKAVKYNPELSDAYMQMGRAYFLIKNYDEAEKCIKKAMVAHPNDLNALGNLGTIYLSAGKYPEALDVFKRVLAAEPKSPVAHSNLGHCYFSMKQYGEAINMLTKAIELRSRNDKDLPCLALACKASGNMALALEYEAAVKKYKPGFSLNGDNTEYN